jgi:predicted transcriptional regulator
MEEPIKKLSKLIHADDLKYLPEEELGPPEVQIPERVKRLKKLRSSQHIVLTTLEGHEHGMKAYNLSWATGFTLPTVYRLLEKLVKRGFVAMDKGYIITPKGCEVLQKLKNFPIDE